MLPVLSEPRPSGRQAEGEWSLVTFGARMGVENVKSRHSLSHPGGSRQPHRFEVETGVQRVFASAFEASPAGFEAAHTAPEGTAVQQPDVHQRWPCSPLARVWPARVRQDPVRHHWFHRMTHLVDDDDGAVIAAPAALVNRPATAGSRCGAIPGTPGDGAGKKPR